MPLFAAHQDIEDSKMKSLNYARAFQAALIGVAMIGSATLARADIKDYEFQLVDQTVKSDHLRSPHTQTRRQARARRGHFRDTSGYGS